MLIQHFLERHPHENAIKGILATFFASSKLFSDPVYSLAVVNKFAKVEETLNSV